MRFQDVATIRIPEGDVQRITSNGVVLWEAPVADFRAVYQRVDYIASPGGDEGGYLITDFVGDNSSGIEITASFDTLVDSVPMGSRINSDATRFYVPYPLSATAAYYGFNAGKSFSIRLTTNTKYRLQTNFQNVRYARIYSADGTLLMNSSIATTLTQQVCPVYIFRYLNAEKGTMGARRPMKAYGARITQGSEIVREYVPCYRKQDGAIGMFELHTEQFLTTPDGTVLTKGADVDW